MISRCKICKENPDRDPVFNCLICMPAYPLTCSYMCSKYFHELVVSLGRMNPEELEVAVMNWCEDLDYGRLSVVGRLFPGYLHLRHLQEATKPPSYRRYSDEIPKIMDVFRNNGIVYPEQEAFQIAAGLENYAFLTYCLAVYPRKPGPWLANLAKDFRLLVWLYKKFHILPTHPLPYLSMPTYSSCVTDLHPFLIIIDNQQFLEICQAMTPLQLPAYVLLWITDKCVRHLTEFYRIKMIERYYATYRKIKSDRLLHGRISRSPR